MSPLESILQTYRETAQTEREKGTCSEELVRAYPRYEAICAKLYYGSAGAPARTGSGGMRTGVSALPSLRPRQRSAAAKVPQVLRSHDAHCDAFVDKMDPIFDESIDNIAA